MRGRYQGYEFGFGYFEFVVALRLSRWKYPVSSMVLILIIAMVIKASVAVVDIIIVDLFSGGLKPFLIYLWIFSALLIPQHRIGLIFYIPALLDFYMLA